MATKQQRQNNTNMQDDMKAIYGRQQHPPENCCDFVDREHYRWLPPCGETVIYWIYDTDFCECVLDPMDEDPRVEESTVNVTA